MKVTPLSDKMEDKMFNELSKTNCPNCGKKGFPTTLMPGKSFACKNKKCSTWWVIPTV